MERIELRMAYYWVCPDCGGENFERAVYPDLTLEDREEAYRELSGLEAWQELPEGWEHEGIVCAPTAVKCSSCLTRFHSVDES